MVRNCFQIVAGPVALVLMFVPNVARAQHAIEPTVEPLTIASRILRTPKSSQVSNQTLSLEAVEINKTSHTMESVLVRVRNLTAEPQSGILWYVFSLPGEPEPWRVFEY
jgi:hypothetical protein